MRSERCILRIQYTGVGSSVRKQVSGFMKYIEHRDQHRDDPKVAGILKYIAHRDEAVTRGDMFGPQGPVGKNERRRLVAFVAQSVKGTKPQLYRNREGKLVDVRRSVNRLVLSPEFAEGLDLKQVTRAALAQLEQDCGGLGPWIAAEHRNTAHRHVHIVLAARRQVAPGQYRSVRITRERLERMKQAMHREIEQQRQLSPARRRAAEVMSWIEERKQRQWGRLPDSRFSRRSLAPTTTAAMRSLRRLARQQMREAELEAQRRLREREHDR